MAQFVQTTSNISTPVTGSTAGVVLPANPARIKFHIQNVGVNPIYLLYGDGTASSTYFHQILKAGTAALDGTSAIDESNGVCYTGRVSVGGTAPTYVAFEIAP